MIAAKGARGKPRRLFRGRDLDRRQEGVSRHAPSQPGLPGTRRPRNPLERRTAGLCPLVRRPGPAGDAGPRAPASALAGNGFAGGGAGEYRAHVPGRRHRGGRRDRGPARGDRPCRARRAAEPRGGGRGAGRRLAGGAVRPGAPRRSRLPQPARPGDGRLFRGGDGAVADRRFARRAALRRRRRAGRRARPRSADRNRPAPIPASLPGPRRDARSPPQ